MQTFPLNYFSHLNSPRRLFAGRRQLSWPKLSLIFLFLVALMVMPITMYYTNQVKAIPMEQFLTVHQLIDQDGVNKFLELPMENGQINHSPITIYQNNEILIGSGLTKEQKTKKTPLLISQKIIGQSSKKNRGV
ncbi:maltodextrose utilization protein MalA [Enterococcus hirae ATCC 9790]|uniref:Maltodextrose utilization protein MalA n=1 Tax=Enterococcus hirae (strain ATCC 9790 / DSM 20160 / JCM 8729 / LMG 6399 / NBRC 3181 / NCIMB 6459 / NCDO 1258 / NCTC 12367 / WDCM 00089 / R) TaxID=768486 RepID=I6T8Q9_ENTHA|nr:maltodextrose utilization protein MalA [Enterococcus hirae]AFM71196.1 maltodextrose utilization protein MalA [Enterococcus hirae ATCC 9790]